MGEGDGEKGERRNKGRGRGRREGRKRAEGDDGGRTENGREEDMNEKNYIFPFQMTYTRLVLYRFRR